MTQARFIEEVLPKVNDVLATATPSQETEKRSAIVNLEISAAGERFQVITQNTKKDSKYARCALKGHKVVWVINQLAEWTLVIDGVVRAKSSVQDDGTLV